MISKSGTHKFFQLCNVEAPTLIMNGVVIGLRHREHSAGMLGMLVMLGMLDMLVMLGSARHSAGMLVRFLDSGRLSTILALSFAFPDFSGLPKFYLRSVTNTFSVLSVLLFYCVTYINTFYLEQVPTFRSVFFKKDEMSR